MRIFSACFGMTKGDYKVNNMEIKIKSLDNIREAAKAFLDGMGTGKVFAFYGKMGLPSAAVYSLTRAKVGDVITSVTPNSSQIALMKVVFPAPILP